jgi:hypothetical protein
MAARVLARRSTVAVLLLGGAASLGLAGLAAAKEGARARLASALPLRAPAGATIRVEWTVSVPDDHGGRQPFVADGMFVRLLSRTGARATESVATSIAPNRNVATIAVPAGGIGGIRVGMAGTACDAKGCRPAPGTFPLENSPFVAPGGAVCDVAALAGSLRAFVRAYNSGDLAALDRLFSKARFGWYSSAGTGIRRLGRAEARQTLMSYFRRRHELGDMFSGVTFRFNGYEPQRELGHFELRARRRAAGYRGGRWFEVRGKGALDCSKPRVTIAVMSIGGPSA